MSACNLFLNVLISISCQLSSILHQLLLFNKYFVHKLTWKLPSVITIWQIWVANNERIFKASSTHNLNYSTKLLNLGI